MYKRLDRCICCDNPNLFTILDLGNQPPANDFHNNDIELHNYELKLMGCDKCWHTQISIAVDPAELFRDYIYVSGTSNTMLNYFKWFAEEYGQTNATGKRVLDIASNDGSQLNEFAKLGWETWGVDPAENLAPIARAAGHNIISEFWNKETATGLPTFDLITAQNVFAHTADVKEFLEACKSVMHDDTVLVIQTSQAEMFDRNEFDTIYHEHISFFSTSSMKAIAERAGLELNHVYTTDVHGTSYVFELGKRPLVQTSVPLRLERESNRYCREFYDGYRIEAMACVNILRDYVDSIRQDSAQKVVGYGAAAKGIITTNVGRIKLDYIVDDNPMKQNKLTPGMNIPVVSSQTLANEKDKVVIVPLAWNFYDEIREKVKSARPKKDDVFVRYFPVLRVDY